jgi:hypothetical protein
MVAIVGRKKALVQLLIRAGADVNRRNSDGETAYRVTQTLPAESPGENAAMQSIREMLKQARAKE